MAYGRAGKARRRPGVTRNVFAGGKTHRMGAPADVVGQGCSSNSGRQRRRAGPERRGGQGLAPRAARRFILRCFNHPRNERRKVMLTHARFRTAAVGRAVSCYEERRPERSSGRAPPGTTPSSPDGGGAARLVAAVAPLVIK